MSAGEEEREIVKEGATSRHIPQIGHFRWGPSDCVHGNRDFDLVHRSCVLLSTLPWLARLLIPLTGNYSSPAVQRGAHLQPGRTWVDSWGRFFGNPGKNGESGRILGRIPYTRRKKRFARKGRKSSTSENYRRKRERRRGVSRWGEEKKGIDTEENKVDENDNR